MNPDPPNVCVVQACSGETEDLVLQVNDKLTGLSKDIKHSLGLYSEKVLYEKLSLVSGYLNLLARLQDQATFFHSKVGLARKKPNPKNLPIKKNVNPTPTSEGFTYEPSVKFFFF